MHVRHIYHARGMFHNMQKILTAKNKSLTMKYFKSFVLREVLQSVRHGREIQMSSCV